jgi:hypothetical protein
MAGGQVPDVFVIRSSLAYDEDKAPRQVVRPVADPEVSRGIFKPAENCCGPVAPGRLEGSSSAATLTAWAEGLRLAGQTAALVV